MQARYIAAMKRTPIAVVAGLVFFVVYIAIAMVLADVVLPMHWWIQIIYFVIAGALWVMPVRWLMLWAVHQRG